MEQDYITFFVSNVSKFETKYGIKVTDPIQFGERSKVTMEVNDALRSQLANMEMDNNISRWMWQTITRYSSKEEQQRAFDTSKESKMFACCCKPVSRPY